MRRTVAILIWSVLLQLSLSEKLYFWLDYDYVPRAKAFFKVHHTSKCWLDAVQTCASEGATLVNPRNIAELKDVLPFMDGTEKYWIGHQHLERHWGQFSLFQRGHYILEGKVGDLDNRVDRPKYCVSADVSGKYFNTDCDEPLHSICKKSAELSHSDDDIHYDVRPTNIEGYVYSSKTNSYYKSHEPSPWLHALATCASEGAVLAAPQDERELSEVLEHKHPRHTAIWIDAHQLLKKGEPQLLDQGPTEDQGVIWTDDQDYPEDKKCHEVSSSGIYSIRACEHFNGFVCKKVVTVDLKPTDVERSGTTTVKKRLLNFSNLSTKEKFNNQAPTANYYDPHTKLVIQRSKPQQRFLNFEKISTNREYNNQRPVRYVPRNLDSFRTVKSSNRKKLNIALSGSYVKKTSAAREAEATVTPSVDQDLVVQPITQQKYLIEDVYLPARTYHKIKSIL